VTACRASESSSVSFDLSARDASCLVRHRLCEGEDTSRDMVASPRERERA
jgi:hypothetical protein